MNSRRDILFFNSLFFIYSFCSFHFRFLGFPLKFVSFYDGELQREVNYSLSTRNLAETRNSSSSFLRNFKFCFTFSFCTRVFHQDNENRSSLVSSLTMF